VTVLWILALTIALLAVVFAVQNVMPVTGALFAWVLEGSVALVVLVALMTGAFVGILAALPAMLRARRHSASLRRQIAELEASLEPPSIAGERSVQLPPTDGADRPLAEPGGG
jgi:putative membrane protein